MQNQPIPQVTAADVARIVARDFPPDQREEVHHLLASLGANAQPRLQLAILKLSRGDVKEITRHLAVAMQDWRDTLMAAEYPAAGRLGFRHPPDDAKRAAWVTDWEQYHSWLTRETR